MPSGKFWDLVKVAIVELKERNGSSLAAIKKHITTNNKGIEAETGFNGKVNAALSRGVADGALVKVKASYKLSQAAKKTTGAKVLFARSDFARSSAPTPTPRLRVHLFCVLCSSRAARRVCAPASCDRPRRPLRYVRACVAWCRVAPDGKAATQRTIWARNAPLAGRPAAGPCDA